MHIVLLLRCDVFAGSQARGRGIPSPEETYEVLNDCIARFLASDPGLRLPTYAEVAEEMLKLGAHFSHIPMPEPRELERGALRSIENRPSAPAPKRRRWNLLPALTKLPPPSPLEAQESGEDIE